MSDKKIVTAFTIAVHDDGSFMAQLEQPEAPLEVERVATVADVLSVSKMVVKEIEMQELTSRIVETFVGILQAGQPQSPADVVKDALKDRGIQPESPAASE